MNDLMKSMFVAAAGMMSQSGRMRVIAENMANANSTAQVAGGDPYRRKIPVFKNELDREVGSKTVRMSNIIEDQSAFGSKYSPGHPAADANGYIKTTNVNALIETMDMSQAQRSYEANLNIINSSRRMMTATIDLLRR